jgi:hypothetical protein
MSAATLAAGRAVAEVVPVLGVIAGGVTSVIAAGSGASMCERVFVEIVPVLGVIAGGVTSMVAVGSEAFVCEIAGETDCGDGGASRHACKPPNISGTITHFRKAKISCFDFMDRRRLVQEH